MSDVLLDLIALSKEQHLSYTAEILNGELIYKFKILKQPSFYIVISPYKVLNFRAIRSENKTKYIGVGCITEDRKYQVTFIELDEFIGKLTVDVIKKYFLFNLNLFN